MLTYFFNSDHVSPTILFVVLPLVLPLVLVWTMGPWSIRKLRELKAGQPVREAHGNVHAPDHAAKEGTPTMGGVLIIGSLLLYSFLFLPLGDVRVQCVLLVTVVTGFLGFLDDCAKIKKHNSDGVNGWFKIGLQTLAATVCAIYLYTCESNMFMSRPGLIMVPFYGFVDIGWLVIPLAILTVIATSNAVNLTDGLDGLASGCMIPASLFFALFAFLGITAWQDPGLVTMVAFSLAIISSCLGFLWYNCHPAKVFMGDTGSLALGGALGGLAVCTRMELMLILVAGVFVAEATSVVMQVVWFKITRRVSGAGRRLFRMAPLHHHFEKGGMSETQVCVRFWIVALILCIAVAVTNAEMITHFHI